MASGDGAFIPCAGPRRVRLLALLPVTMLLLSGCASPEDADDDPLFGFCPSWEPGTVTEEGSVQVTTGDAVSQTFGDEGLLEQDDRPLDVVRITIDTLDLTGGTLELRAYNTAKEDQRRPVRDYRFEDDPQMVPLVTWGAEDNATDTEYDVHLTPVRGESDPAPGPVRLTWTVRDGGQADVDFTVSYHYRVCAAA